MRSGERLWFDYMRLAGDRNGLRRSSAARAIRFVAIFAKAVWCPIRRLVRRTAFDGLDAWLRERFFHHEGNADVIRQELASEHGIVIGRRSVELRVKRWRRELKAQKRATVRFETAPGHQLQIDFGETLAPGSSASATARALNSSDQRRRSCRGAPSKGSSTASIYGKF